MKRPPVINVQLIHIQGIMKGEIQEFSQDVITVGRNQTCDIRFPPDLTVISRKHAEIIREGNQFKLVDYSTNGTFVNGKRIKDLFLKSGDVIEFSEGGPKVSFLTLIMEAPREDEQTRRPDESPEAASVKQIKEEIKISENIKQHQELQAEIPVQSATISLVIQYGPSIHSFKQLPVTIGRGAKGSFMLDHPSILDQHAQIFFFENKYWIKDLTGQKMVQKNNRPIDFQAPLEINDRISLSPMGPIFSFIGLGRLAEVTETVDEEPSVLLEKTEKVMEMDHPTKESGFFSRLKKKF